MCAGPNGTSQTIRLSFTTDKDGEAGHGTLYMWVRQGGTTLCTGTYFVTMTKL